MPSPPRTETEPVPLRRIAWWASAVLVVEGAFLVGSTALEGVVVWGFPEALEDPTGPGAGWLWAFVLGELGLVATTVIAIPLWAWWHRAAAETAERSGRALDTAPRWHASWWFVPVANLWKPYQAMGELWRASRKGEGGTGQRSARLPGRFPLWWACWLLGWPVDELSTVWPDPQVGTGFGVAGAALQLAALGLYLGLLWEVTRGLDSGDGSRPPTPARSA